MEKKKKILIVDDAQDVRKVLGFHLGNKGYETLEAADGLQGLRMIEEVPPDLLILDINMPKMSGLEVYNNLLKNKKRPLFPVIVLTVREELRTLFEDLGVEGFISKPFEISRVLQDIDAVIKKRNTPVEGWERAKIEGPIETLIIEDDQEIFEKLFQEFAAAGFFVDHAKNGLEAMEKLTVHVPHFIMVNLDLSGLSGDVFIIKLKNMSRTMDIPCLLYTQHFETMPHEVMERIYAHTKSKLLPCDPAALLKEVNAMIDRKPDAVRRETLERANFPKGLPTIPLFRS